MSNTTERLENNQGRRDRSRGRFAALLDTLEDRMLLSTVHPLINHLPSGKIVVATNTQVVGYVSDVDDKSTPLSVKVVVDGTEQVTLATTANQARPQGVSGPAAPSWYVIDLSSLTLPAGPHSISIQANDIGGGADFVTVATKNTPNQKPVGTVTVATQQTLAGNASDPDSPGQAVEIFASLTSGGKSSTPTDIVTTGTDGAFSVAMPTHLFGTTTVKVYVKDTFDGSLTLIATKKFVNNKPSGAVQSLAGNSSNGFTLVGYAFDKDMPGQSLNVVLKVDGQLVPNLVGASLPRTDLVPKKLPDPNHGFSVHFNGLAPGKHTMLVYAEDPVTGVTSLLGSKTITVK